MNIYILFINNYEKLFKKNTKKVTTIFLNFFIIILIY